ncbi:S8 family serine peptidase [Salipiger sp.]|uniref:S8 family serine peptidase n=1 Tax=Salipiger sp. TaxID=2078585 RepID=UPI003A9819BF
MAIIRPAPERQLVRVAEGPAALTSAIRATGVQQDPDPDMLDRAIAATARLETPGFEISPWVGCGFLVAPRLVMVARYAADQIVRLDDRKAVTGLARPAEMTFGNALESPPRIAVTGCPLYHPVLNIALLELAEAPDAAPLVLDGRGTVATDTPIAVIGAYGNDAWRNDPAMIAALGSFAPGDKVVAPGRTMESAVVPGETTRHGWSLGHDCTTLGGAGGAPLVDLGTGHVLGLHFAGRFLQENSAVPASELALDTRLRALGLTFVPGSAAPDAAVFEARYPDAPRAAGPFTARAERGALSDNALMQIDRTLAARFSGLEPCLDFLRGLGPDYAAAIDSQPGRGRLPQDRFRRDVLGALDRRGLLAAPAFREALAAGGATAGAAPDTPPEPAAPFGASDLPELASVILPEIDVSVGPVSTDAPLSGGGGPFTGAGAVFSAPSDGGGGYFSLPSHNRSLAGSRYFPAPARAPGSPWSPTILNATVAAPFDTEAAPLPGQQAGPLEWVDLSFLARGQEAAKAVCAIRAPEPTGTGWLLAPGIVVTTFAALGIDGAAPAAAPAAGAVEIVFDTADDGAPVRRRVGSVASVDAVNGLVLLRLDQPVVHAAPLQIARQRTPGSPVACIHHPAPGPKVMSYAGARLLSDDTGAVLIWPKTAAGDMTYSLAVGPGSTGAPVFDQRWKVIATHLHAVDSPLAVLQSDPVARGASLDTLLGGLEAGADATLWREIVGAQKVLRSVDPGLMALAGGETRPVVIDLVDAATPLPDLPGVSGLSRSGQYVFARIGAEAVELLGRQPGVVSIEESRASSRTECRQSLPFVGIPVDRTGIDEDGAAAMIAVIDDGLDPFHECFTDAAGASRIALYWDQTSGAAFGEPTRALSAEAQGLVAAYGLNGGILYTAADLAGLGDDDRAPLRRGVLHGTAVASIAAGRGTGTELHRFSGGIAPAARILAVRFNDAPEDFGADAAYIRALDLIDAHAEALDLPVVVNISSGIESGARDGTARLENRCAAFVAKPWRVVVKSAGNERNSARHSRLEIDGPDRRLLRWKSLPASGTPRRGESDVMEIWFSSRNSYELRLEDPEGGMSGVFPANRSFEELLGTRNLLQCRYDLRSTDNRQKSRVVLRIAPGDKTMVQPGEWRVHLRPTSFLQPDVVHAWLCNQPERTLVFAQDVESNCTITVPGTGLQTITVAAMESGSDPLDYPDGSEGPNSAQMMKPDLIAPGVRLAAALAGTDRDCMTETQSGTSLAAPHVSGAAALALSMAAKAASAAGLGRDALEVDQTMIRDLMLLAAPDYRAGGSYRAGYGRLHVARFLDLMREDLARLIGDATGG